MIALNKELLFTNSLLGKDIKLFHVWYINLEKGPKYQGSRLVTAFYELAQIFNMMLLHRLRCGIKSLKILIMHFHKNFSLGLLWCESHLSQAKSPIAVLSILFEYASGNLVIKILGRP